MSNHMNELSNGYLTELKQFVTATWDGDVASKHARGILMKRGFLTKVQGYTILTKKGLRTLIELGVLKPL